MVAERVSRGTLQRQSPVNSPSPMSFAQTHETGETDQVAEQKQAALHLMLEAFAHGEAEGLDADCMAQAALFTAFKEFVSTYGEAPVAEFARRLPERVLNGEFTVRCTH
jgi:hypothetical protein